MTPPATRLQKGTKFWVNVWSEWKFRTLNNRKFCEDQLLLTYYSIGYGWKVQIDSRNCDFYILIYFCKKILQGFAEEPNLFSSIEEIIKDKYRYYIDSHKLNNFHNFGLKIMEKNLSKISFTDFSFHSANHLPPASETWILVIGPTYLKTTVKVWVLLEKIDCFLYVLKILEELDQITGLNM